MSVTDDTGQRDSSTISARLSAFVRSFVGGADAGPLDIESLTPEASTRFYHRVKTGGRPASCVVMELPDEARGENEARFPFLNVHKYLSAAGFPVPAIYRAELARGLIAIEDLGDETLERVMKRRGSDELLPGDRAALYEQAIDLIVKLQALGAARPDPECVAFGRRFDHALLRWELDHFREWLLEADRRISLSDAERQVVDGSFDALARTLADAPAVLAHRDFQSRNLMVVNGANGLVIRVIDFQDALWGPRVYDLVALLRDSYVTLDPALVTSLLNRYAEKSNVSNVLELTNLFHKQTVQRKLKDAGRFVQIHRMRGNPSFLPSIAPSLAYAKDALARVDELAPLRQVLARHVPELRD